jgi:NAD+ synthase
MANSMLFSRSILDIDTDPEITRITDFIRDMTLRKFKRRWAVIGLSGGVDSAVSAELCVRALGKDKVLAVFLPERESNPISLEYGQKQAQKMGVETFKIDITENLESLRAYEERDSVIKTIFPEFDNSYKFQVILPQNLLEKDRINYHSLIIEDSTGNRKSARIPASDWLRILASQNTKQRIRMVQLYYYAEKNNYIVVGTTNMTESAQGFYVKFGDGGVDIEPLAHLYKTQVYQLAKGLGVIKEIINRPPSPDTYSLPATDKELYFCLDYELLDLLIYAYENKVPVEEVSSTLGLTPEQIRRLFKEIKSKEEATWHLRQIPPTL